MNTTIILLELFAKSAALLAGAMLCAFILRRASAARRNLVWAAAFASLLALPLTKIVSPRWLLPVYHPQPHPAQSHADLSSLSPLPADDLQPVAMSAKATQRPHMPDWWTMAAGLWIAGCAAMLGYRFLGSLQLALLKRRSAPGDGSVFSVSREIASEFGIARPVDIRLASEVSMPMTWGIWKPVLVLPADIVTWHRDRLAAALRHEFAHIARNDCPVRLAAQIVTALYWPNPLVWLASRSLQMTQEEACDNLVLHAGTPADEYATLLLDAGRKWSANNSLTRHGIAMARPAALERRVTAIVDETRDRRPAAFRTRLATSLALAAVLAICAVAQVSTAQEAASPTPSSSVPDDWPPARNSYVTLEYAAPSKLITPVAGGGFRGPDGQQYATPQQLLEGNGVEFPAGSSANYLARTGKLVVRDTIENQNAIGKFYDLPPILPPTGNIKLPDAIIPKVSFNGTPVRECMEFFRKTSIALDTKQTDPARKGVNFVLKQDANDGNHIADKKITLNLTNVSFREAFKKFVDFAGVDAFSEPYGIVIIPISDRDPTSPGVKTVELRDDGNITLNGVPVASLQELVQKLQQTQTNIPDLAIVIDPGSKTSVKQISDLVDMLKKLGIKQVGVQARPGEGNLITATPPPSEVKKTIMPDGIIPVFSFRQASVEDCLEFFHKMSVQLDPTKKGVDFVLNNKNGVKDRNAVTVYLTNIPFSVAMQYFSKLANVDVVLKDKYIEIIPRLSDGNPSPTPTPAAHSENQMNIESDTASFEGGVAMAKGHAELKSGALAIKADAIKYDSDTRNVEATGHVFFERHDAQSDTTTIGEKVSYNLVTQKLESDGPVTTAPR